MGYCSEVAIIMKGEDAITLFSKAIARTVDVKDGTSYSVSILVSGYKGDYKYLPVEEAIKEATEIIGKIKCQSKVLFHWEDIKWYYDDVNLFIMPFVKQLKYFEYVRVGEEEGDIETDCKEGECLIYPKTYIDLEEYFYETTNKE